MTSMVSDRAHEWFKTSDDMGGPSPPEIQPMAKVTIRCRQNGPLVVEGEVLLLDSSGNPAPLDEGKTNIALCRCGFSKIKPLCDGSHNRNQWKESPESER
ncbi:MAG: CDGSH iron-sulfur domain-containing protein [Planctomycetota bacterium]